MKKNVSVVPADNIIVVDGIAREVVFSVDSGIRALQWYGDGGHVEYGDGSHRVLALNQFDTYLAPLVALWEKAAPVPAAPINNFHVILGLKKQEIREKADEAIKQFNACYSSCEANTWPMQEAGARILCGSEALARNGLVAFILTQEHLRKEAVALVEELAAGRHIPAYDLAEAILTKAHRLASYSELIFAEQRGLLKSLQQTAELAGVEESEDNLHAFEVVYTGYEDFALINPSVLPDAKYG